MKAHVMKLENNCVIVDEEYFNEIKKESEFNQERINEIAEEKFLKYVKESGIKLSYKVNDIPYLFHHDLLYEINYDAITDELLIKRVEELLGTDNIIEDNTWGYDHGIWSILHRVYPEQDIPLVVLSVDAYKTPKEHYEFGKKLRELREEGYLILGSGNIVHNLGLVDFQKENGYDWAEEFDNEIKNSILSKKIDTVINFENIKNNNLAFRTPEHFLPILYILGAVHEEDEIIVFNDKCIMGSLSMTSYLIK